MRGQVDPILNLFWEDIGEFGRICVTDVGISVRLPDYRAVFRPWRLGVELVLARSI